MNALRRMWQEHRALFAAFVVAAAVTLFFAVRMALFTLYWANPAHREQPLAGWMTLHYVAHSWHVPPQAVIDAARVPMPPDGSRPDHPRTLDEIARKQGIALSELVTRLRKAIAAAQAAQQRPPPAPGDPAPADPAPADPAPTSPAATRE